MLDLVCFYADLGRPYVPLITRMTETARAVMPDARLVLISPTPAQALQRLFDMVVEYPKAVTAADLMFERVRAQVSWAASCECPTVFVDPDLEFRRPVEFQPSYDIGLMWRTERPETPVNAGMVLTQPGQTAFWRKYGEIVANLPAKLRPWWCEQIGYALMTGVFRSAGDTVALCGSRVRLLDGARCPTPEHETDLAWAVHNKGARKGPGWDAIFPAREAAYV